jgi:hypothetical protein
MGKKMKAKFRGAKLPGDEDGVSGPRTGPEHAASRMG